jgi:CheY-like chemotaxis protein
MRCLIVDDSADFIDAARRLLEHDGIVVVGVASSGADALARFNELRPDVTLVDINLGDESGFDVIDQLHRAGQRSSPLILISTQALQDFADMVEASPARGFLSKSALSADAVRHVAKGSAGFEDGDYR